VIRRPTSAGVGLVVQQQKVSLESAEWAREIYHGSKNEPRACPGTPVCGPAPLGKTVGSALVELGHDPARVKTERFGATGG
jgi:ferredoxin-NADP reductase